MPFVQISAHEYRLIRNNENVIFNLVVKRVLINLIAEKDRSLDVVEIERVKTRRIYLSISENIAAFPVSTNLW